MNMQQHQPMRLQQIATRVGLELPDGLEWVQWEHLGVQLQELAWSYQWYLGDWLLYGEHNYGEEAYQAVQADSGLALSTLQKAAWVCQSIPLPRRVAELTFSHHERVAALTPDEQEYYLGLALQEKWSVARLAATIKSDQAEHAGTEATFHVEPEPIPLWFRCPQCQHEWSE
jgi:hypothetical protein